MHSVTMNKAYKFRIYPTKEQQDYFTKCFGCTRFIYNKMLADKIAHYAQTGELLNNTPAQYKQEFPWLKEVDSYALCNAQLNLQKAYGNFFRDKSVGFPKFKSKKNSKFSYTTNNVNGVVSISEDWKYIKLCKVKQLRVKFHRRIPADHRIKSCTISQTASGKYYISILTEYERQVQDAELDKNKALGIDYSSPHFYVDSQGIEADYPKFYRTAQAKLAQEQRKLSHMKLGSNNYIKQRLKVARIHERIHNQRQDWLHKLSTTLANNYDYICIESINLQGMSQCLHLGKATMDNGFGMFRVFLDYKLANRGKMLIKIDKWFPSSKLCHFCGCINEHLTLDNRIWKCSCGQIIERDVNAAINIRNAGLQQVI